MGTEGKSNVKKRAKYASGTLGSNNGKRAEYGAGSFRVTPSGNIECRFYYIDENGKKRQKSITGADMNECISKVEDFRKKVEISGKGYDPDTSLVMQLREIFKNDLSHGYVKEQGYCRNLGNIKVLEKSEIGNTPIRDVKKRDVIRYLESLEKYSEGMVKKLYAQVKLAYAVADMRGLITENFMETRDMKCPKIGKPTKKVYALTTEQQKRFVDTIESKDPPHGRNDYRIQLMIELYSGMRMGEINALRREDIDFENNVIHVRRTISRGLEYRDFLKDGTKTDSGQRDIPISSKLKPYLETALEQQQENKDDLIFYDYNKDSMISTSQVNNYYRRICEKANIPNGGQHALRHTFATRCIESGIPAVVLKNWLGHTNIHITLDIYTDVFNSMNNKAVGEFDKYLESM